MSTGASSDQLVGRAGELVALRAALAETAAGATRTLLVGGEAGVGKSRLVAELVREVAAEGADPTARSSRPRGPEPPRVLLGQCVDLGAEGPPFGPFVQMLRTLVADVGADALAGAAGVGRPELARLLPELGPVGPQSDLGRGRLFEVVAALLERAGERRGVVAVVEDLHWADPSTRDLFRFLAITLRDSGILLLATYRSDELVRSHPLRPLLAELERLPRVDRVELGRLSEDEVHTLVSRLDPSASPDVARQVYARSGGVPFFVEELLVGCALCADGFDGGGRGDGPRHADDPFLPRSLSELMLVRLERLSEPATALLRVMAAGGERVAHAVLAEVAGLDDDRLDAVLREAVAGQVLVVDPSLPGYAFRHALMREAIHADLLPGEHGRLHTRYAETLSRLGPPLGSAVETAHHWYAAQDQERAFAAALAAAEETRSVYAWREELLMLERAAALWDRVEDAPRASGGDLTALLERAARAAYDAGEIERCLALLDAALAALPGNAADPPVPEVDARRAHLLLMRASAHGWHGVTDFRDDLDAALRLIPPDPPSRDRADALALRAAGEMLLERHEAAIELAEQALTAATAAGDDEARVNALNTLGVSRAGLGDSHGGLALLDESRDLADRIGDVTGRIRYDTNRADVLDSLGRYRESREASRSGRTLAASRGLSRKIGGLLISNEAASLRMLGDWDEALALVDTGLRLDPSPQLVLPLAETRAQIALWRGDLDAARADVALMQARVGQVPAEPQLRHPVAATAAEVALADGASQDAVASIAAGLAATESHGHHWAWLIRAVGYRAVAAVLAGGPAADQGRDPTPATQARALLARLDELGARQPVATPASLDPLVAAERLRADPAAAVDPAREIAAWQAASDALAAAEGPVHLAAYAQTRLAGLRLAAGDRDGAADLLAAAARGADRLGAQPLLDRIDDLARRARLRLAVPGESPAAASPADPWVRYGLTPREREVLDLVAAGRTNGQVAQALFISTKTASVHVSNILAKLDVASRGEAAALAHRLSQPDERDLAPNGPAQRSPAVGA